MPNTSIISPEDLGWGEPFKSAFEARSISDVVIKTRRQEKKATLEAILPRKSKLSRKAAGKETDEQLIAANLDIVFVVTSLIKDFNARRLERYLSMVSDSGAAPVVLLSKADQAGLDSEPQDILRDARAAAAGVPVNQVSAVTGAGLESLQDVREGDDRGRHTTTFRRLIPLPPGFSPFQRSIMAERGKSTAEGGYPWSQQTVRKSPESIARSRLPAIRSRN